MNDFSSTTNSGFLKDYYSDNSLSPLDRALKKRRNSLAKTWEAKANLLNSKGMGYGGDS